MLNLFKEFLFPTVNKREFKVNETFIGTLSLLSNCLLSNCFGIKQSR